MTVELLLFITVKSVLKSELRWSDHYRAAKCVENIFFKTEETRNVQVPEKYCNRSIKAGQLKQQGAVETLIHHNEGFKFLRVLKGLPPNILRKPKRTFLQ